MRDHMLDESTLTAFRHRADGIIGDGLQALADGLAQVAELTEQAIDARAESEHQKALLVEQREAESSAGD